MENKLDKYTHPNMFRVYSTSQLELTTLNDIEKAIKNKLFILTEGLNFEVEILNEEIENEVIEINTLNHTSIELIKNNAFIIWINIKSVGGKVIDTISNLKTKIENALKNKKQEIEVERIETLTESINKKINVTVKLVDTVPQERTFNLLINLEQSSDLQQLLAVRYLLEKPNSLKSSLLWNLWLKDEIARKQFLLPPATKIANQNTAHGQNL